jgi:phospholipase/lecithinase/hemolysin
VVFGDSLSDDGAYTLAAISVYDAPPFNVPFTGLPYAAGGQFTINGAPTGNWTDVLASDLGTTMTPNLIGYGTQAGVFYLSPGGPTPTPTFCAFSAPVSSGFADCTNFAEGGAMVTNPSGIGHTSGALTVPVVAQVQSYLTQYGGTFNSNQLVTVLAGNNDIFTALGTVAADEAGGMTSTDAVAAAHATVEKAADDLAAQVKLITTSGGTYVLVFTLPDSSKTPFGRGLPYTGASPAVAPPDGYVCDPTLTLTPCFLLSNLVQVFNQRLLNDLQGQPVKVLDGYGLFNQMFANPAQFGFTNTTEPVCDIYGPVLSNLGNSSLFCNPDTLVGGIDPNASLFADDVHPTPAGYQIIAGATVQSIHSFGWTP